MYKRQAQEHGTCDAMEKLQHTAVMQYIVRLVRATRRHAQVVQGASPRATLALAAMAKAAAFARGCDLSLIHI